MPAHIDRSDYAGNEPPTASTSCGRLHVCDVQPGTIAGARNEFVYSGRLDNLCMSYCALQALLESLSSPESQANDDCVRCIALFDHEEVGSDSAQGAGGPVMIDTIRRVTRVLGRGADGCVEMSLQNSFLVSADMARPLSSVPSTRCLLPSFDRVWSACSLSGPRPPPQLPREARARAPAAAAQGARHQVQREPAVRHQRRFVLPVPGAGAAQGHPDPGLCRSQRHGLWLYHRAHRCQQHGNPDRGRGRAAAQHAQHPRDVRDG